MDIFSGDTLKGETMKAIAEDGVSYEVSVFEKEDQPPVSEVIVKGIGTLYFVGDAIFLGKEGKWYKINLGDIKIVRESDSKGISIILRYKCPEKGNIQVVLSSENTSHVNALMHILNIYGKYLAEGKEEVI